MLNNSKSVTCSECRIWYSCPLKLGNAQRAISLELKSFVDNIDKVHPAVKFTSQWSRTFRNLLEVTVSFIKGDYFRPF